MSDVAEITPPADWAMDAVPETTLPVPATVSSSRAVGAPRATRGSVAVAAPRSDLTLIEKAAIVLTAIGPDLAAGVIEKLSDKDMERFANAVASMGKISQSKLDATIVEFIESLSIGPELSGGATAARDLLAGLVDPAEIDRILAGHSIGVVRGVWDRLNDAPIKALSGFLSVNHPQTAAVVLTKLRPEIAAAVLEELDQELGQALVLRLSKVPSLDTEVTARVEAAIERDFLSVLQSNMSRTRPADLIAGLMNNISSEARDGFLGFLEEKDSVLAQDVQKTMFTFEDIRSRVPGRDIPAILREMQDEEVLNALKTGEAQGSDSLAFIISNLPRRLADRYTEDLAAMDAVPLKDGEAAQIEMTRIVQMLAKSGDIKLIDAEA